MIKTTLQIKSDSFFEFLNLLSVSFPTWEFQNMSSTKNTTFSHYHIYSRDKKLKGVLEITHDSEKNGEIILKIADNRKTNWSLKVLEDLKSSNLVVKTDQ